MGEHPVIFFKRVENDIDFVCDCDVTIFLQRSAMLGVRVRQSVMADQDDDHAQHSPKKCPKHTN